MKPRLCIATPFFLSLAAPLSAQNFAECLVGNSSVNQVISASLGIPLAAEKAQGSPSEGASVFTAQDSKTLETRLPKSRTVDSVVDLAVLEKPSPFRNIASGRSADASDIPAEGVKQDLALVSAVYREAGKPETNCQGIPLSIEQRVKLDDSSVLEVVETEVKANPSCACEIVKAAIKASDADSELVISIVETSIISAPETMRVVSQCAIAAMPESLAGIQSLLARYDSNAGDGGSSSKSAKSSKDAKAADVSPRDDVAAMPNPLDFPGSGPVGPTPGGPGGFPLIPPAPPIIITPPTVTEVDP